MLFKNFTTADEHGNHLASSISDGLNGCRENEMLKTMQQVEVCREVTTGISRDRTLAIIIIDFLERRKLGIRIHNLPCFRDFTSI